MKLISQPFVSVRSDLYCSEQEMSCIYKCGGRHLCLQHRGGGVPRNFVRGGEGGSTNSVEDIGQRERGSGGGSPLVWGSGGSCNLVQEISFHIVKFSYFLVL